MTKHLLAVLVAVVAAASVALLAVRSEASASGSGDPRIAVLQKEVKTLQKQVKTLQTQEKTLGVVLNYNFDGDTCLAAITADLLQGTWIAVDQATGKSTFGTQTQVNDYGTCERLTNPDVNRTLPGAGTPTINPMLPMLQWLGSP
jgi:ABC-type transport system involved in cytochrome bd biosynthesis fused ATPase/permease subunit